MLAAALWLAACGPDLVAPETPLRLAWQTRVGDAMNRPAVSDGLIFVVDESGSLSALDVETGKKRWEADLALTNRPEDPVATDGGYVFAAAHGEPGKVLAFDARKGVRRWEAPFGPSRHGGQPVASEGVVYFEVTGPDAKTASLRAADASTGAALWELPVGSYVATSPIVGAGLVYVGAYRFDGPSEKTRRVLAVDKATGKVRWDYASDLDLSGRFALDEDHLYIGADGGVVIARDAATGGGAWTARGSARNAGPEMSS